MLIYNLTDIQTYKHANIPTIKQSSDCRNDNMRASQHTCKQHYNIINMNTYKQNCKETKGHVISQESNQQPDRDITSTQSVQKVYFVNALFRYTNDVRKPAKKSN